MSRVTLAVFAILTELRRRRPIPSRFSAGKRTALPIGHKALADANV